MGISVTKIGDFNGHRQSVYALEKATAKGRFLSAGGDGLLVEWDVDTRNGLLFAQTDEALFSLAVDEDRVAVGGRSGTLFEFSYSGKRLLKRWKAHEGGVFSLLYDGESLLSAGGDGKIIRWKTGENIGETHLGSGSLRSLARAGRFLLAAGAEGKLLRLNSQTLEIQERFEDVSSSTIFCVRSRGEIIFAAGRDAKIVAVDAGNSEAPVQRVDAHWFSIHALALSPDGKFLASGSMDKSLKLWDSQSMDLLKVVDNSRYEAHSSSVNAILWLDNSRFISAGDDRRILLFELNP